MRRAGIGMMTAAILAAVPATSAALPTMIRLGYPECASCHVSPQGGGLLTVYGRGIDEAQSMRAGEYRPSESKLLRLLSIRGRMTQDVRAIVQEQRSWTAGQGSIDLFRPRVMYRNSTQIGAGVRLSATITGETTHAPRPSLAYDPAAPGANVFVNAALVNYRPNAHVEVAFGRDQLPTGVNVPDLALFVKSRNRLGYYDTPMQLKLFWTGERFQVTPFAYASDANTGVDGREAGGGAVAEFDLLGQGRTVAGGTFQEGTGRDGDRRIMGAYARVGFGKWGLLAEHDVTMRLHNRAAPDSFAQEASYAQLFVAVREWLVASAVGERLRVDQPFAERVVAGKLELAARLTSAVSVNVSTRIQRNGVNRRTATSLAVQATVKSVN